MSIVKTNPAEVSAIIVSKCVEEINKVFNELPFPIRWVKAIKAEVLADNNGDYTGRSFTVTYQTSDNKLLTTRYFLAEPIESELINMPATKTGWRTTGADWYLTEKCKKIFTRLQLPFTDDTILIFCHSVYNACDKIMNEI